MVKENVPTCIWKVENMVIKDTKLNMVCTYSSGCYGRYGAQVHVQLPIKVWFCFPRRLNNGAFCYECLIGCNFRSD